MRERVCNNCGGKKYKGIGQNIVKCLFCGTIYVDEYANKEEEILIVQAYEKIREFKFAEAVKDFDKILTIYPKSHEAYYGRLQAKNKVIYFNSKEGTKRSPSFFGKEIPLYLEDDDFKKAVEFAPKEIAESYTEQAKRVEKIRDNFLKYAQKYSCDVILNTKSDSVEKLLSALKEKNLKVFLRKEIKEQKKDIEAFTFQAIQTAKVEILLVEREDDLLDTKIRNLFQRFLYLIETNERFPSSFVVAYNDKDVSLDQIKKFFPTLQKLYSINDINFVEDLTTFVKSAVQRDFKQDVGLKKREVKEVQPVKKEKVEISTVAPTELGHYNIENIPLSEKNKVKWIFSSIKNGDFETAEKLLMEENDSPSGEIFFASLLCDRRIKTEEEFFSNIENFKNKEVLENILKYSTLEFANDFVNKWERLIVQEKDVDVYLQYLEFLAQYQNSLHDEFIEEAEKLALKTLNEDLIEKILKCFDPADVDKYTNFYFQLAQKSGDESYYYKILELDEGHPQSLFALFSKNFETLEGKLSYRDGEKLENVLKYCDSERRCGFLVDIINIVCEVSFYDLQKAEEQFDFYLSYIDDDTILTGTLTKLALTLQEYGFFSLSEKYLSLAIKNDKENAELYWKLIQVKTHCRNENELLTTSVKIVDMEDWKTLLNFASDEQTEKYSKIVAKANTSTAKKLFRVELLDKVVMKEKLREFLLRNNKILSEANDKNSAKYYSQQLSAFETYFAKIDNAKTFEEYNDIFERIFERLEVMDLTIDTSVNIAKLDSKKENLAIMEKEAKKREEKYLSTIQQEKRNQKRKIVLFCTLELAPMLLIFLFLLLAILAPKETYMVFNQDAVVAFTVLSILFALGNLIYNVVKRNGNKKWRMARMVIVAIGLVNLVCLLFGFYIYPPEISIENASEFTAIAHNASYVDIKIENDIDMSGISWTACDFYGSIDGGNNRIYNLTFSEDENNFALFDNFSGKISNLTVELAERSYQNVEKFAVIALTNNGSLENIYVVANVELTTSGDALVGGLVALHNNGEIINSGVSGSLSVNINGDLVFGGLVGETESSNVLSGNFVDAEISFIAQSGSLSFGGLVGENSTEISTSKSKIILTLEGDFDSAFIGGLVGRTRADITNSYAVGSYDFNSVENVTAGGLAGELYRRHKVIEYCYQNITFENAASDIGALVGSIREGIVRNSFAVSSLDNLYLERSINDELACATGCKIFETVDDLTSVNIASTFGFSQEIWSFSSTLPELKIFE